MLDNLVIVNGSITPQFDSNIYEYTVYVDSTVMSLVLSFDTDKNVTVYGNDYLTEGENHVLVEVYDTKVTTYTLNVYKDSVEEVSFLEDNTQVIEINKKDYITPIISVICFITIVFLFYIIFKKSK